MSCFLAAAVYSGTATGKGLSEIDRWTFMDPNLCITLHIVLYMASCLKHTAHLQGGGLNGNVLARFKNQHLLLIVAKH